MDSVDQKTTLSAPYRDIPLITVKGKQRTESSYGQLWEIPEEDTETRPFIVYEYKDASNETIMTTVEMRSHLRSAMLRIMDGYPNPASLNLEADPLVFEHPFADLGNLSSRIFAFTSEKEEENKALAQLRYFMSVHLKGDLEKIRLGATQNSYAFDSLWTAYVPGELVIEREGTLVSCYKVIGLSWNAPPGQDEYCTVGVQFFDFDGDCFGFANTCRDIPIYKGQIHGSKLPLIPVKSLPSEEWEGIKADCITRGKRWFELQQGFHHLNYRTPRVSPNDKDEDTQELKRVIVDRRSHFRCFPAAKPRLIVTDQIPKDQLTESTYDQKLLAPPEVGGVKLDEDHWVWLRIDHLVDIEWAFQKWEELELDPTRKETIRTLVKGHDCSVREPRAKGSGLMFFLSGPPGTGKTLTIESLAESLRRPLYSVSPSGWSKCIKCIDGERGRCIELERAFTTAFEAAQAWNAIVTIDELIPMMTKSRSMNAKLQAFLRRMEDYQGVVFLTSNVDEEIEPNFESRLTAWLEYDRPTPAEAERAWERLLTSQLETKEEARVCAKQLSRRWHMDHRKMSSVILLAKALSKARKIPITKDLLEEVLSFKGEKPIEQAPGATFDGRDVETSIVLR